MQAPVVRHAPTGQYMGRHSSSAKRAQPTPALIILLRRVSRRLFQVMFPVLLPVPFARLSARLFSLLFAGAFVLPAAHGNEQLHAFYYGWYGTPAVDGQWSHWDHAVLPFGDQPLPGRKQFPGGEDIGANFFPLDGPYSSHDPAVIQRHVRQMKAAGIGVISVSWSGSAAYGHAAVKPLMDEAARQGLKVNFQLEPVYRNAQEFHALVRSLMQSHGSHPALYRLQGKPLFYVYDSYKLPQAEWQQLLPASASQGLRKQGLDAHYIGLWVDAGHGQDLLAAGFDGFYSYFAVDGFVYGSSTRNWPAMAAFARQHGKLFIPSVGPGYADDRIRPWNARNFRDRETGAYYDRQFAAALQQHNGIISITSFNEWHEGTQIEPAETKSISGYRYLDYTPLEPDAYLQQTRRWSERLQQQAKSKQK